MYNPHTVTLVITSEGENGAVVYDITYLEGVFLDEHHAVEVNKPRLDINMVGLYTSDSATLYIPLSQVKATNAANHRPRQFLPLYDYNQKQDKTNYYTVFEGGNNSNSIRDCFFVRGKISGNQMDYGSLRKAGAAVYRVSSVIPRDYGMTIEPYVQVGGM